MEFSAEIYGVKNHKGTFFYNLEMRKDTGTIWLMGGSICFFKQSFFFHSCFLNIYLLVVRYALFLLLYQCWGSMENSNKVADKMIVKQNLNSVAYQLYILTWNFSGLLARHFIKVPNQTNDTKDNPIRFASYCSSESQCSPPNLIPVKQCI